MANVETPHLSGSGCCADGLASLDTLIAGLFDVERGAAAWTDFLKVITERGGLRGAAVAWCGAQAAGACVVINWGLVAQHAADFERVLQDGAQAAIQPLGDVAPAEYVCRLKPGQPQGEGPIAHCIFSLAAGDNVRAALLLACDGCRTPELTDVLHRLKGCARELAHAACASASHHTYRRGRSELTFIVEQQQGPAFVIDDNATILAANSYASSAAPCQSGITMASDGSLRLAPADLGRTVRSILKQMAITQMADATDAAAPDLHAVSFQHDENGRRCWLLLIPLRPFRNEGGATRAPGESAQLYLALMKAEDEPLRLSSTLLQSAFDLTPAEASILLGLASGSTLKEYADERGLKITTARWHLANVLRKTGGKSQADLIRQALKLHTRL